MTHDPIAGAIVALVFVVLITCLVDAFRKVSVRELAVDLVTSTVSIGVVILVLTLLFG